MLQAGPSAFIVERRCPMPIAALRFWADDGFPWLPVLIACLMCVVVAVWTLLARKRFTLGSVMVAVFVVAVSVAGMRRTKGADDRESWFEACLVLVGLIFQWVVCCVLPPVPPWRPRNLTTEQSSEVAARILACEPRHALMLVREYTRHGVDKANAIHREQYRKLRAERPEDFTFTDEHYWRCLYD